MTNLSTSSLGSVVGFVGIAGAMAKSGKRSDPDPGVGALVPTVGATSAARDYNTAVPHLRIDRHILVNPKAPASSKVAANLLLFTDNVTTE